mmetsp:Transcript_43064/g.96946  ORF Transcript_43064/g.96946 Transcript_43064/m.96946 type:complete len:575 (+) Transcript_43064:160-1884(+)
MLSKATGMQLFVALCLPPAIVAYDADKHLEKARLYGSLDGFAYYFVDMILGTPPQRVSVILDTGSGFCAFPCKSCAHCGHHLDTPFDFGKSSSAHWVKCGKECKTGRCEMGVCSYRKSYLEGSSINGWVFEDVVSLGDAMQGNPPVKAHMGCHRHENKLFYTQKANGIFGIQGDQSLLRTFFKDRAHVDQRIFSICLSKEGGQLTVGGSDTSIHHGQVQWVSYPGARYEVPLSKIVVGHAEIAGFSRTIVDSGTTFTYLPSKFYLALRTAIDGHCKTSGACGTLYKNCYRVKGVAGFPSLRVQFDARVHIRWEPHEYLYLKKSLGWCFGFENDGHVALTTLGASFMLNKEVIFDIQRSRIGIVPAKCPHYALTDRPAPPAGESWDDVLASVAKETSKKEKAHHSAKPLLKGLFDRGSSVKTNEMTESPPVLRATPKEFTANESLPSSEVMTQNATFTPSTALTTSEPLASEERANDSPLEEHVSTSQGAEDDAPDSHWASDGSQPEAPLLTRSMAPPKFWSFPDDTGLQAAVLATFILVDIAVVIRCCTYCTLCRRTQIQTAMQLMDVSKAVNS